MSEYVQKKKRIRLSSLEYTRKYLARKIKEFENDPDRGNKIPEYRCIASLVRVLIEAFEKEKIEDIERRIEGLEQNALRAIEKTSGSPTTG